MRELVVFQIFVEESGVLDLGETILVIGNGVEQNCRAGLVSEEEARDSGMNLLVLANIVVSTGLLVNPVETLVA